MTMLIDDAKLLTAFALTRDEAVFRILAERHFGLVFHTALRRTGSRMLAEEISQNVLCAIAAKAGMLALHPERFPAWLHRATLFEASKAMRTEESHQRRSQLQHPDALPATSETDGGSWDRALPYLDTVLDALPTADRRIVVLHFFESMTFPRIAALLGKSPAAVQKQSVRALEKLSRLLRAKGVAASAGALAAGMFAESAKAVPVSLLPGFTASAMRSAQSLTFTIRIALMMTTHSKTAAAIVLLALALPLGFQEIAIASAERDLASLSSPSAVALKAPFPTARGGMPVLLGGLDLQKLADEVARAEHIEPVRVALERKLAAESPEELVGLLDRVSRTDLAEERRTPLIELLGKTLMARDMTLGMRTAVAHGWLSAYWVMIPYSDWLRKDPGAAQAWLLELQKLPQYAAILDRQPPEGAEGKERLRQLGSTGGNPLLDTQKLMVLRLMAVDPEQARAYLQTLPEETSRLDIVAAAFSPDSGLRHGNIGAAEASGWLTVFREDLPEESRDALLARLAKTAYEGGEMFSVYNVTAVMNAATTLDERRVIATTVAQDALLPRSYPVDPKLRQKVDDWLSQVIPEEALQIGVAAQAKTDTLLDEEAVGMLNYYAALPTMVADDEIVRSLSAADFHAHLPEALALAEKIRDPDKRASTLAMLKKAK